LCIKFTSQIGVVVDANHLLLFEWNIVVLLGEVVKGWAISL
jgi:hypothetical protein